MIHVLSVGTDRKLFEKESAVSARNILYGEKLGEVSLIVFSLKSQGFVKTELSPQVIVYPTNSVSRWMYVWDALSLGKKIVREKKFVRGQSVVTCQDPFECGFVGWRIARYFRFPLHLQIHTDFLSPYFKTTFLQRIRVLCGKFLLPRADAIRVVSERIKDSLRIHNIGLRGQVTVLPIRITSARMVKEHSPQRKFPQFDFVICMASRLEKEKRIEDALTAFAVVHEQFPKAGLVIMGTGSEETSLKQWVKRKGLSDSVVFLGWVDSISEYMQDAQVFLSTSEYEGYGMSVVEAGLLGVPVVSTAVGVAGELLRDGENSYVCPVGDTMCVTKAIIDLLTHNEKRYTLSSVLRDQVRESIPSEEEYVRQYVSDFERLVIHI